MGLSQEQVDFIINHLFLPPKLPQADDRDPELEHALLQLVSDAATSFADLVPKDHRPAVLLVAQAISQLTEVRDQNGTVSSDALLKALRTLSSAPIGTTIPLHINAQNAGIILSQSSDGIVFEAFELSPLNAAVMTTKGRLRRSFPGPAIAIPTEQFGDAEFQKDLANTLSKMSKQEAIGMTPTVNKSQNQVQETRDTTHPGIVTELLLEVLGAFSRPIEVQRICKHTRDEVLWKDTRLPWRRSPLWLLMRVLIQLQFTRFYASTLTPSRGSRFYKLFMIHIMAKTIDGYLPPHSNANLDRLHCMVAKLVGRVLKLERNEQADEAGLSFAQKIMMNAKDYLKKSWDEIRTTLSGRLELEPLRQLNFEQDTKLHLSKLDDFLARIPLRTQAEQGHGFIPSATLWKFGPDDLPSGLFKSTAEQSYTIHNLHAFEKWVSCHLAGWINRHLANTQTCQAVGALIGHYHKSASILYEGHPESWSVMILTIMELWVACDKSATKILPLLADYDPGLPQCLLRYLLLPFKEQMERLRSLELYLQTRCERARYRKPGSIFTDFGGNLCFAVRFFDQSQKHQEVRSTIENHAIHERQLKVEELARKKKQYNDHMRNYKEMSCEFGQRINRWGDLERYHLGSCSSCHEYSLAKNIGIEVHEWPLPCDTNQLKAVVFELDSPTEYCEWREATTYVLLDVLKSVYSNKHHPSHSYELSTCDLTRKYYRGGHYRIRLLSEDKPHYVTHRNHRFTIQNTTNQDVCLNNGLKFHYFDADLEMQCFTQSKIESEAVLKGCTYNLPGASSAFRQFIYRKFGIDDSTPNHVIASQSECPPHFSLSEYRALASIPVGHLIGWENILAQVRSPLVDFKKPEVSFIVFQTMYQAGPMAGDSVYRAGHSVLANEQFIRSLQNEIREAAWRIEENWESMRALGVFISMTCRHLSLTTSSTLIIDTLQLLSDLRAIAVKWLCLIQTRQQEAQNDHQRAEFRDALVEAAFICCGTFDIDDEHLETVLLGSNEQAQASILIRCSILIHDDYSPKITQSGGNLSPILHRRWERLSYRAYPLLVKLGLQGGLSRCLDESIRTQWPAYNAGDEWVSVGGGTDHWVTSITDSQSARSLRLHYDLLTGRLLVDGLPRTRLPSEYENHAQYRELFGRKVFQITPSPTPGIQFCGQGSHYGYSVQFGFAEPDLIVQVTDQDHTLEVLPRHLFQDHMPHTFAEDYSHWYNAKSDKIFLRERSRPWETVKSTWILSRDGVGWKLEKDGARLVSTTSSTASVVASIFAAVEAPLHINSILVAEKTHVEIELPRHRLEFCLKRGTTSVTSRKLRGFEVDSDQSIGTLVGLNTRLVLKNPSNGIRKIVIPPGAVGVWRHHGHVLVTITSPLTPTQVAPYVYTADPLLQRLTDNGDLQSKLFISYLHGLTSFCLPDPLTSRTGTEQALSILKSSAVKSFPLLSYENLNLLKSIDSLTPRRAYYPPSPRVMQTIQWNDGLPSLSQHPHFHTSVAEIFEHYMSKKLFYPEQYLPPPSIDDVDSFLLSRDSSRSSRFRISCFGAEDSITTSDIYTARDNEQSSDRAREVQIIATMMFRRDGILYRQPSSHPNLAAYILEKLKSVGTVNGSSICGSDLPLLEYDSLWLDNRHPEHWAEIWCWLHWKTRTSSNLPALRPFSVMMWLATMAFAENADLDLLHAAAAMFLLPGIRALEPPDKTCFLLSVGDQVNIPELRKSVLKAAVSFENSPENRHLQIPRLNGETGRAWHERKTSMYSKSKQRGLDELLGWLSGQYPTDAPTRPQGPTDKSIRRYFDITIVMTLVVPLFSTWYDNRLFTLYIKEFGKVMSLPIYQKLKAPSLSFKPPACSHTRQCSAITTDDFFQGVPAELISKPPRLPKKRLIAQDRAAIVQPRLEALVQRLESNPRSRYEQQYAKDLRQSSNELHSGSQFQEHALKMSQGQLRVVLEEFLLSSEQYMSRVFDRIVASMREGLGHRSLAEDLFQTPRLSPMFLIQQLSKHGWAVGGGWDALPANWKAWIVRYGKAVARVQRAKRLLQCLGNGRDQNLKMNDLIRELRNEGHSNWSPFEYPEALLLEIENNITVREVQADIAEHMINPSESQNAVMQLNMGEGKSSVIVPIVGSALADRTKLVRVFVAKPQSRQMFHMLMLTLGGMINRQIFHLPFSRAIKLGESEAKSIANQCKLCQETGGIMLLQPEHMLSFKLMGLESQINGNGSVSHSLLKTQHFFDTASRDIVDESDENFSVKFELIYPLGTQHAVDFAPNRWTLIQDVLRIIRDHINEVADSLPHSMEVVKGPNGSFPRIRFLKSDAATLMLSKVTNQICTKGLLGFPIHCQKLKTRQAVLRYISKPQLSAKEIADVEQGPFWSESTKNNLWLLRGLFARGILNFVYGQKRWRVNYGLDKSRDPPTALAVPYRAKDSPAPRSEFSHPDVVIALTCNSYYYQGLSNEELFLTLEHLMESDQADVEYEEWKEDASDLPSAFRQLVGINLRDALQCKKQLFPSFRFGKRTIDYYLQHIVFSKHMKEFPKKLTASGWDLGAVKTHPTTGFSGTMDSHKVLPLDVAYLDLPDQKHTNARVLEYLLRPENDVILLPKPSSTDDAYITDAEELLRVILGQNDQQLRVILDVGAQILELTNAEVARTWLRMTRKRDASVEAAIYFDDREELMVLDFKGVVNPLQTSSYKDQLGACLVFLDEAHTRGTNLIMPRNYRAAVTIGPNLTKDRLVQACMRMRQLGYGQSVVFCVPAEVQRKIQELQARHVATSSLAQNATRIGILEVLEWSISETIVDLQRSMPLWAMQGERFDRQVAYWKECTTENGIEMTVSQARQFLEDEAETLEERYSPQHQESIANTSMQTHISKRLRAIQDRCAEVGAFHADETTLQEEQERELAHEIEEERQNERPASARPEKHSTHIDLKRFVSSGTLPERSTAVMPAFTSLKDTSAAGHLDVKMFPHELLVTTDFSKTIVQDTAGRYISDAYQRPVQWILTSQPKNWNTVIIISPWEANELLPKIRKSKHVTLHIYCPRPNQEIKPLDSLDLYSVPSLPADWSSPFPLRLRVQLNLFAGQLYLKSPSEYAELCNMLRLSREEANEEVEQQSDGFILSANSGPASEIVRASAFTESPVPFLNTFLVRVRKDCQSIAKTHLGKILSGVLLRDKDFQNGEEGAEMDASDD